MEQKLSRIQDAYENGGYDLDEFINRKTPINTELVKLQQQLQQSPAQEQVFSTTKIGPVTPELLKQQLTDFLELSEQLDVHEFRTLLQSCIKQITVKAKKLQTI